MSKSKEELEEKYRPIVEATTCFTLKSIDHANYRPHIFMVGVKHVTHAADHCGGMLGDETLNKIPCAHPGCNLLHKEHTYDTVMFLSFNKMTLVKEAREQLKIINEAGMDADGIDGFCFVATPENYRAIEEGEENEDTGKH